MQMTNLERMTAARRVSGLAKKLPVPLLRQGLQIGTFLLLATLSYFLISKFLLQTVKVVGRSMRPTLYDSERCLLNRWIYRFRQPQRYDIVVLRDPSDNGFSVKRIIALPGDSIYLKNGDVYLNGVKMDEPYLESNMPTFTNSKQIEKLILCGKDQYYLLGDNRLNSVDSRTYGPVPRANLLGPIIR